MNKTIDPRYRIVILEGADGTGKTTLANELEKEGYQYIHCTYNHQLIGNMTGYFMGVLFSAIQISRKHPVVIDRWRMSEVVYGEVFRGGPESPFSTKPLFEMADAVDPLYVFCHPWQENRSKYIAAFEKLKGDRPEMYEKMEGVYDSYERHIGEFIAENKRRNIIRYDRFNTTVEEAVENVMVGF